ncbi:hypothetical protein [Bacillus cereus]|uniref:hypothetical protein n=1 Tax=Bacillus cereus TaxID=1396 RepID=UPI000B4B1BEE|nr:hypothetical protein [Bacillus cereus]
MKYFEFANRIYYALIIVDSDDENDAIKKATNIYVELLEKEGIENRNLESKPIELIRIEALSKYLDVLADMTMPDSKFSVLVQEFDAYKNAPALVCRYKTGNELV